MASVDKVKVADITYDVSPSKDGTLNGYTSGDSTSPSSWNNVDAITTSDTNSSIFSKLTTMVKNVRWLYNKLGTVDISATGSDTISGGLVEVQNALNNKAASSHTHGVNDLPVSNSQVDSTSYVPSSAVIYSLKSTMDTLSSEIQSMQDRMNPNNRYESKYLGTWSSVSDVDTFLSRFNHDNLYKDGDTELAVGNTISFNVLSSPVNWYIAGFDLEHNQTAADGTTYDNGYGICLIPVSYINRNATTYHDNISTLNGYISSDMHTKKIPYYVPDFNKILGSHLVQRNVLLSSSKDNSTGYSNGYTWTTAYGTLMSVGQCTGTFASHKTKYDDGEANYKLPLFDHIGIADRSYWLRNYYGSQAYYVSYDSNIYTNAVNGTFYLRPMIYIR